MRKRILVSLLLLFGAGAAQAGSVPAGTYRCWQYNVSGGGGTCRFASPIELNADGTYKESRTVGTYEVREGRVYFSKSTIRGPGRLEGGNRIRFEYDYKGFHHDVTYLCRDCRPESAPASGPGEAALPVDSAIVDLSVKLRFDPSEGDMGWASTTHLVPLPEAGAFLSSGAPMPPAGSSTGLAWTESKNVVATRFRSARSGRTYAVILDAGRERIAVAEIRVPPAPEVQEATLDASLKNGLRAGGK
jgi:hypothetical protein